MDFKQIQELIKMINKSNVGELTIEQDSFKITIKQKEENITQVLSTPGVYPQVSQAPSSISLPSSPASLPSSESTTNPNTITIKSPMIGTFYRKPAPDKANYIDEGDVIAPGKVICVVEAMKLFNEIESEVSGRIVKILVEDSTPVEFDQPLFLVEP